MKILLSNDDGVYAPGLKVLYDVLKNIAQVKVIAPDRDRSAVGKSLTLNKPIYSMTLENGFTLVEGTPSDSVHYALTCMDFMKDFADPDMIVAGINRGPNLGDDIMYSGTVAAATEGRFLGFPSVAISLAGEGRNYDTAGRIAHSIVSQIIQKPLDKNTILNVNIPDLPYDRIQGYKITRLGSRRRSQNMLKIIDPRGKAGYWIGLVGDAQDSSDGTDFFAIKQGYVSITPLRIDLTNHEQMAEIAEWTRGLDR